MAGAKFQLWNDVNGDGCFTTLVDTVIAAMQTTAADGKSTWTDLAWGNYLVQETAAPTGYTLPTVTIQSATIGANNADR